MPAAKQRSRSRCEARAVTAMMVASIAPPLLVANGPDHLESVHVWHVQIEEHEIVVACGRRGDNRRHEHPGSGLGVRDAQPTRRTWETLWKEENNQPLVPYFNNKEKAGMRGTKVIYSCLPPDEWGDAMPMSRSSFAHNYPKEIQERVLARWKAYGFGGAEPTPVEGSLGKSR